MGRWAYTVFGGDTDMDIAADISEEVGVDIYGKEEELEEARIKLDAGLGAEIMKKYRAKEKDTAWGMRFLEDPKYITLLLGAYFMTIGAKIAPGDRAHLRACWEGFEGANGYRWPMNDAGFRMVGKVQYGAALDHYVDGQRRSFFEPCCYNCGKIEKDIGGTKLKRCTRCVENSNSSYYCNQDCQKQNWKAHKVICQPRRVSAGGFAMANV